MLLDSTNAPTEAEVEWRTGTAIDEITAVYRVLARPVYDKYGRIRRAAFSPSEVDAMDLSAVAVLMGAGVDKSAADRAELETLAQQRAAGLDVSWGGEDFSAYRRPPT